MKQDMYVLGISAFYHDSAAVLLQNDKIVAAAQEERFTRKKNDAVFPSQAIVFCLEQGGISLGDLDAVVFYEKPFLKFERLLETYYTYAPKGLRSFLSAMPVWIKEKLFLKKLIVDELKKIGDMNEKKTGILFSNHHLSHAASAFFPSPFQDAAILTVDGVGEWATATIAHGKNGSITTLKEIKFPHSLGLFYSACTYFLGFKVNDGEYKLMGLAPYGDPASERVKKYKEIIKREMVDIKEDGSFWLNQKYFDYATGLKMIHERMWKDLFGFPRRRPEDDLGQQHCDLALATQQITEEIILKMAKAAKEITGEKYLCLAGGVALNCVANSKILNQNLFDDIWIQPAAGDAGGALGAAYAVYYAYFKQQRRPRDQDAMQGAYLGPEFDALDMKHVAKKYKAHYRYFEEFDGLCRITADLLANGNVVGWFQGRMEWGPRALGNRSILGDARNKEMQRRLNLKIKYREGFRPFAPSVLSEDMQEYFEMDRPSPYMQFIANVVEKRRNQLPQNYYQLSWKDRLYYVRSDIPAITHLDYSARLQTVHQDTNERYWELLCAFKKKTGCSVIVNTSFNVRDEPIVCTPEDAYKCFIKTEMDYLVMGNFLFDKQQ